MRFTITVLLFTGVLLLYAPVLPAAELTGKVTDSEGNGLPSVSVITDIAMLGTMTDEAGYYQLKFDDSTVTRVTFSSVGYYSKQVSLTALTDIVVLEERYYRGTDILVRGDRAQDGISPVAFDDFSSDEIERDYTVGEFPLLLQTTPNFYAYSDGGAPLGYSYTSIRGFDDKRIATYINGVPLNDPEDQATYFTDLPDFAANIDDIQVQRGVGNSLYGDGSFGGTINVAYSGLSRDRYTRMTFGYGEYTSGGKSVADIYKQSIDFSSGLIDGRWHFTGRFSKQKTSGYRENSWYRGWAYAFSLGRVGPNTTTELYIYGGPMRMHLAYWGASREAITENRRSNVLAYDNETDNFNQPHYHLHHNWQINDRASLQNTFYYVRGRGYYEQYKDERWYAEYDINASMIDIDTATGAAFEYGDLVRQQWVHKNQYGWNPTLTITGDRHSHTLGGSFYYFESDHWGQVVWAQHINGLLQPQHRYYQYDGKKWVGSLYAQTHSALTDRLSSQVTAQFRYQRYRFDQSRLGAFTGYDYTLDWFFVSPRIGFNYSATDQLSLFTNFAISSRTPTDASIYDANDPYILPSLAIESVNADSSVWQFGDALMDNERVYDFELGGRYAGDRYVFELNFFWMDFRNEIIPEGGLNENTGLAITTNADRSVHAGVETSTSVRPNDWLAFSGNFSYNYNRVKKYIANINDFEIDLSGKRLTNFPDYLGNFITDIELGNWRITNQIRFVGRRYMELFNIDEYSLDPYVIASLSVQHTVRDFMSFGSLTLSARVDNIGDKKYEASGYGGNFAFDGGTAPVVGGWAEYFVAPERSFYVQMQLEMF
jgi:iron complex outermembrane receptor protein